MFTVEKAIILAAQYHEGQKRWNGEPYVNHLFRVMLQMDTDYERIIAVLHDSLEDTKLTSDILRANGCLDPFISDIIVLTHDSKCTYEEYIENINGRIPIKVKIADLMDNRNLDTLGHVMNRKDYERLMKYGNALKVLRGY